MDAEAVSAGAKPLRMTAREFVACLAVLAGAAKLKPRQPKRTHLIVIGSKPLNRPNGQPVWAWVKNASGGREKVQLHELICTHVNHGKVYPRSSKRQQRRYAMQEGKRLLKLWHAGAITIDQVRDGVGLPPVAVGGDNYFAVSA